MVRKLLIICVLIVTLISTGIVAFAAPYSAKRVNAVCPINGTSVCANNSAYCQTVNTNSKFTCQVRGVRGGGCGGNGGGYGCKAYNTQYQ